MNKRRNTLSVQSVGAEIDVTVFAYENTRNHDISFYTLLTSLMSGILQASDHGFASVGIHMLKYDD
jgi:hypothetical protein